MIDARDFLDSISNYDNGTKTSADKPVRLGTIDSAYTSGLAKIKFDGDTVVSVKGYAWVAPYVPAANDRVALIPVGQSYLIVGKIQTTDPGNYVEIQFTQASVPNATVWGPGQPAFTSRTNAPTGMCRWTSADTMTFDRAGTYTISYGATIIGATITGRSFLGLEMTYDTRPISRSNFGIGEDTTTTTATIGIKAGETLKFVIYQTSGTGRQTDHRIRITRTGDF